MCQAVVPAEQTGVAVGSRQARRDGRAAAIGKAAGLRYVYEGNVPGEKGENTYCHGCGALLVEPSSRVRTITWSGSRSCAISHCHTGPSSRIVARSAGMSIVNSSMSETRPESSRRYEASAPTVCRSVSRIDP